MEFLPGLASSLPYGVKALVRRRSFIVCPESKHFDRL
jgi:hypothetical protein